MTAAAEADVEAEAVATDSDGTIIRRQLAALLVYDEGLNVGVALREVWIGYYTGNSLKEDRQVSTITGDNLTSHKQASTPGKYPSILVRLIAIIFIPLFWYFLPLFSHYFGTSAMRSSTYLVI